MERRQLPAIREYLQSREVQERIQQKIAEARSKATVTISRAAELFDFTENKLRDWERRGLLGDERASRQDGRSASGHRQYTPADLDKLAVIRELLDQGYTVGDLERDREEIWQSASVPQLMAEKRETEQLPIDRRIERMDEEEFWRYFVSQALRLSLTLITENVPNTIAGLILPLFKDLRGQPVPTPVQLPVIGESLIGWVEPNHSFHTFLDSAPHFEYESDFRTQPLVAMEANIPEEDMPQDSTLIVLQRRAKPLTLSPLVVETIRRLLEPLYKHIAQWKPCFSYSMRDWVYLSTDFRGNPAPTDTVLNKLANTVIELGGKTGQGQDRWNFCCILLPQNPSLPLQQQSLIVRAQSDRAPHTIATTTVTPEDKNPGLSLKAFQGGHVIYLSDVSPNDPMIAYQTREGPVRSAIAIPISEHDGLSVGVMYIASNEAQAFSKNDQRLLRMISRMVEELLATYNARQQFPGKLMDILARPEIVDTSFEDFLSEGDFIKDVQALLITLKEEIGAWEEPVRPEPLSPTERTARFWEEQKKGVVSFIAITVDNHSSLAGKYGDGIARNLMEAIGLRIRNELASWEKYANAPLYHIGADRFYMMLKGIPLEDARSKGYLLKQALKEIYHIYSGSKFYEQSNILNNFIDTNDISVNAGVSAYPYAKIKELLLRDQAKVTVTKIKELIIAAINKALDAGKLGKEDSIGSWNPETWVNAPWSP